MDEKKIRQRQEREVDFKRIWNMLIKKSWLVALITVIAMVVVLLGTLFFVTPQYESSVMFYVNNNKLSIGSSSVNISTGDISASKALVESYITILMTRSSLNAVIDYAEVDLTYKDLEKMITAGSVNDTEIFRVTVTSPDPKEAQKIAAAIEYILPNRIDTIIEGTTAKVVDSPIVPVKASSPSYMTNAVVGALLGFVMSISVIVLRVMFDITVREESDITDIQKYPILASVPDMTAHTKGGYYRYAYAEKTREKAGKQPALVGKDISFAASEAYKLLRTKLQFSFADGKRCHVIGVSSAMAGEGKSLSSANIAYSLAELGKKVILIDCDLRRPSLADKLGMAKFPGLSNYLSGLCSLDEVIQQYNIANSDKSFQLVSAGGIAPNPVELLSSDRMSLLLDGLSEEYDYVILDFPPVGEVSDALAVVQKTDGVLLVVRQNYCNRQVMAAAVRQFEFVGARILGVVYNSVREQSGAYAYRKKYYYGYNAYSHSKRGIFAEQKQTGQQKESNERQ